MTAYKDHGGVNLCDLESPFGAHDRKTGYDKTIIS